MGKLNCLVARFGAMHFAENLGDEKPGPFLQKNADLLEEIER